MDTNEITEELYRKYATNIQRVCYLYLGDVTASEDAMQETFLKAYEKYNSFQKKSDIKTWLTRIAINTCKDMLRKDKKKIAGMELAETQHVSDSSVEDRINKILITEAIQNLAPELKEVVILFYYQEFSTKIISSILFIPRTTVEYRLKKARKELKKYFEEVQFYEYREHKRNDR